MTPNSPAARATLRPGDVIVSANGNAVGDVIDLRYETAEERFTLGVRREDAVCEVAVEREYGEDLGITYEFELADRIHTCNNKCVFCFIHQMPKRMRRSLYLMDDDYRLSFLHGNYVTLTNLREGEFERIVEKGLSPIYVSVHATDPLERQRMLGKKEPQPILPMLRELGEHGVAVHAQIVLCPGYNDGNVLEQTVRELAEVHPTLTNAQAGVESVAIVPVGLTKNRAHLAHLEPVEARYAENILDRCEEWRRELKSLLGTFFVFPSDEWFFLAGRAVPPMGWYEDFPQYEDGIGTIRSFLDESLALDLRPPSASVSGTILTAHLAEAPLTAFAGRLNELPGVDLNVAVVRNEFFGPLINVAGLMTGMDMLRRMSAEDVRELVFIPSICVNDSGLLLDDIPVAELGAMAGKTVVTVEPTPAALYGQLA